MIDDEQAILLEIIKRHPNGLKEYDLLKILQAKQPETINVDIDPHLALFQQHFLLFHALYTINDQLHQQQAGQLIISALNIQWLPYQAQSENQYHVAHCDPLREYYLDMSQLQVTKSEDVEQLLASFWFSLSQQDDKQSALQLFDLREPCDFKQIKKRYHELLAIHHPDKGGSVSVTQSLNDAMTVLKRCYQ